MPQGSWEREVSKSEEGWVDGWARENISQEGGVRRGEWVGGVTAGPDGRNCHLGFWGEGVGERFSN